MVEGEFRALTDFGSFRINGFATYSSVVPLTGTPTPSTNEFRGYLESAGKFQIDPRWSVSYSGRIATDRTFMRKSEEHTSELQSLMRISYAVFCLKKKKH